jgi:hypothetical protein
MLGGTAASMLGARQQARQRRDIINRQLDRTRATQASAQRMVQDEGAKYTGEQRANALQSQEGAAFEQAQKDVGAYIAPTAGGAGRVSDDFVKARADKAIAEGSRLTAMAREAAKLRAPSRMQQQEALRRADMHSTVGSMLGTDHNMANAAQLDAESVDEPLYGQLGKLAAMAGTIYGLRPGMPAAPGTTPGLRMPGVGPMSKLGPSGGASYLNPTGARIPLG